MDIPTIVTTAASSLTIIVLLAGFVIRLEKRMDAKFEKVDERFERLEKKFDERFDRVEADITELKVAVARLEGPPPILLRARN